MVIFRWLSFILIYRSHLNRWAAVVPPIELFDPSRCPVGFFRPAPSYACC